MRRFLARFSEPVWSGHVPSWADFITTTPELTVMDLLSLGDGTMKILVNALKRAAIIRFAEGEFLTAETTPIQESCGAEEEAFNLSHAVLEKLQAHRNVDGLSSPMPACRAFRSRARWPTLLLPFCQRRSIKSKSSCRPVT